VPLTLLGFALLGAFGFEDVWRDSIGPAIQARVTRPVYSGIDYSVERIFQQETVGLIVPASLLVLWHLSRGMRIVMKALNAVHDKDETRSRQRLLVMDFALAVVAGACVVGAFLVVVTVPRLSMGLPGALLHVAAWVGAALLLGVAMGVVIRYGPAERPEASWASVGSLLVVVTWLVTSLVFGWWAGSVADYKSAVGSLTVFLLLTTYVLTSTSIFLIGAQLDELARKAGHR